MIAYAIEVVLLIAIYCLLVAAFDLNGGYAGLVSVCQAAYFGCGAYVAAFLTTRLNWSTGVDVVAAGIAGAVFGASVGWITTRLKADGVLLVTFGLQIIFSAVVLNWSEVTRGAMGMPGIPGFEPPQRSFTVLYVLAATVLGVAAIRYISRSPYGRVLTAIRDSETFASSLGKSVHGSKISATALSASITAVAGGMYAHWQRYISPESFTIDRSILVLSMLVLGGGGSTLAIILGAAGLVVLPELARLTVGGPIAANLQGALYGAVLVIAVCARPRGLWLGTSR